MKREKDEYICLLYNEKLQEDKTHRKQTLKGQRVKADIFKAIRIM